MKAMITFIILLIWGLPALSQFDTIKTYLDRSNGYKVYTFTLQGKTQPLTGSNDMYILVGSKFLFSGRALIKGVLVAFADKKVGVDGKHQIIVYHLDLQGNMPVGQAIGVGEFYMNQITADNTKPVFTYLPITVKPPIVSQNFGVMIHTRVALQNDDYLTIFSNKQGDGQQMRTTFDLWVDQNNNWHYEDLWDFPEKTEIGEKPDIDLLIVPILDYSSGMNSDASFDGIRLVNILPNPAHEQITLTLNNELGIDFSVSIIDLKGNILMESNYNGVVGSENEATFDLKNFSSGEYFYIIKTQNSKFGGAFIKD